MRWGRVLLLTLLLPLLVIYSLSILLCSTRQRFFWNCSASILTPHLTESIQRQSIEIHIFFFLLNISSVMHASIKQTTRKLVLGTMAIYRCLTINCIKEKDVIICWLICRHRTISWNLNLILPSVLVYLFFVYLFTVLCVVRVRIVAFLFCVLFFRKFSHFFVSFFLCVYTMLNNVFLLWLFSTKENLLCNCLSLYLMWPFSRNNFSFSKPVILDKSSVCFLGSFFFFKSMHTYLKYM